MRTTTINNFADIAHVSPSIVELSVTTATPEHRSHSMELQEQPDLAAACSQAATAYTGMPDSVCVQAAASIDTVRPQMEASVPAGCSIDISGFSTVSTCDDYSIAYTTYCDSVVSCMPSTASPSVGLPSADVPSTDVPSAGVPSAGVPSAGAPSADVPSLGETCAQAAAAWDNALDSACALMGSSFDATRSQMEANLPLGCSVDVSGFEVINSCADVSSAYTTYCNSLESCTTSAMPVTPTLPGQVQLTFSVTVPEDAAASSMASLHDSLGSAGDAAQNLGVSVASVPTLAHSTAHVAGGGTASGETSPTAPPSSPSMTVGTSTEGGPPIAAIAVGGALFLTVGLGICFVATKKGAPPPPELTPPLIEPLSKGGNALDSVQVVQATYTTTLQGSAPVIQGAVVQGSVVAP